MLWFLEADGNTDTIPMEISVSGFCLIQPIILASNHR